MCHISKRTPHYTTWCPLLIFEYQRICQIQKHPAKFQYFEYLKSNNHATCNTLYNILKILMASKITSPNFLFFTLFLLKNCLLIFLAGADTIVHPTILWRSSPTAKKPEPNVKTLLCTYFDYKNQFSIVVNVKELRKPK